MSLLQSQPLETAIGLVLMFFIIALASSSLVEVISQLFSIRAKDLEAAIGQMFAGNLGEPKVIGDLTAIERSDRQFAELGVTTELTRDQRKLVRANRAAALKVAVTQALSAFKGTTVYESAAAGARRGVKRGRPSYLAATSFVDGVSEMLSKTGALAQKDWDELPDGLKRRLASLSNGAKGTGRNVEEAALSIKSGLEHWFDETMSRVGGAYKRWSKWIIFLIGLTIAVSANASAFHVADRLWTQPAIRAAVVDAAATADANSSIDSVADATDTLKQLQLPVGWDSESKSAFGDDPGWSTVALVGGWIVTALLVMLGAPFWFSLLTQLSSLRSTGTKPVEATADPSSSTSTLRSTTGNPKVQLASLVTPAQAQAMTSVAGTARAGAAPADPRIVVAEAFGLAVG